MGKQFGVGYHDSVEQRQHVGEHVRVLLMSESRNTCDVLHLSRAHSFKTEKSVRPIAFASSPKEVSRAGLTDVFSEGLQIAGPIPQKCE